MRRFAFTAATVTALVVACTGTAQPRAGGPKGPIPGGLPATRNVEQKLDQLDARLKEIESRLVRLQAADRLPGPSGRGGFGTGPMGDRGGMNSIGPGSSGPRGRTRPGATSVEFERRLERIIAELELLKKDMRGEARGR